MKIRIKFTKQGAVKFVGHLDIMRYFQKSMRRANVDIRYSEGFSPHQIMSFAAPLGVGLTSNGEYLDIEVSTTESSAQMTAQLNEVMTEGIVILSYRRLEDTAKNAMSIVSAADYTVRFRDFSVLGDTDQLAKDLQIFHEQEQILIQKKTKKSEKEIDIKPMIYKLFTKGDVIHMQVATGSANNLKPELVMTAFYESKGLIIPEFGWYVQREEVYAELAEESGSKLIPLEDLGEDIEPINYNKMER